MAYFCVNKEKIRMTIELWSLGKQDRSELQSAIELYEKRLKHYTKFKMVTIDNSKINKNQSKELILDREAELIVSKLSDKDLLVCLDERGIALTSIKLAEKLNQWMNSSPARIIFLIGGSYGIAESLHTKALYKLSLSMLTFPHQLVRLIFAEQLYRAFTILKNEKYHHE